MGKFDDFMDYFRDGFVRSLLRSIGIYGIIVIGLMLIVMGFGVIDSYESVEVCGSMIPGSYSYNCCVAEDGYAAQTVCKGFKKNGNGDV